MFTTSSSNQEARLLGCNLTSTIGAVPLSRLLQKCILTIIVIGCRNARGDQPCVCVCVWTSSVGGASSASLVPPRPLQRLIPDWCLKVVVGAELLVDVSTAAAGVAGGQRSFRPDRSGQVGLEAQPAVCGSWQTAAAELWH